MLNKLEALKCFCIAAETLQFRETAVRLAVSPQVITRTIAELENELGAALFVRSTRNMRLTEFGEHFLPQAQQYLADGDLLFASAVQNDEMSGVVRITLPRLPQNDVILQKLMAKCADHSQLQIDWRVDVSLANSVEQQIDIGFRIGLEPDPLMIVRHIRTAQSRIVASPALLERLGKPKDLADLQRRFPLSQCINPDTGRAWQWCYGKPNSSTFEHIFTPKASQFATTDRHSELQMTLQGVVCSQQADFYCQDYIANGQLVELFPEPHRPSWQMYLYRPHRPITSKRVLKVFDWLTDILREIYQSDSSS